MNVAFDVGGVLSKYPRVFRPILLALGHDPNIEVFIISDMPKDKAVAMLTMNGFDFIFKGKVHSADYATHGERCKAVLCEQLGIDVLIDDHPGYVADGKHVRLFVMPNTSEPYYADDWKTDGSEGEFGRRKRPSK